ncbi:MAG: hypothetical protein ACT4PT_07615 [Methanobacteriota archaeon]
MNDAKIALLATLVILTFSFSRQLLSDRVGAVLGTLVAAVPTFLICRLVVRRVRTAG